MTVTDVFIHPFPEGDSTLQRMARTARSYGYTTLVAIGQGPSECHGLRILPGIIVTEKTMKAVNAAVRRRDGSIIGVEAGEYTFNRSVIETPGVHLLCGLHLVQRNAFGHVAARLAAARRVAVHLDIGLLIRCRGHMRQKVLTRYHEILLLQRRFLFPCALGSGASSILDQRTVREMILLAGLFGMTEEETIEAMGTIPDLSELSTSPRVVR